MTIVYSTKSHCNPMLLFWTIYKSIENQKGTDSFMPGHYPLNLWTFPSIFKYFIENKAWLFHIQNCQSNDAYKVHIHKH